VPCGVKNNRAEPIHILHLRHELIQAGRIKLTVIAGLSDVYWVILKYYIVLRTVFLNWLNINMSVFKAHSDMAAALTPEIKGKLLRRFGCVSNLASCVLRCLGLFSAVTSELST